MSDAPPWRVENLELTDLRCWEQLSLEFPPGLTVICGPNGAGKTSIVEAVVVATLGVSPRTAQMGDLVRSGAVAMRVSGRFRDPGHPGRAITRELGYASGIGRRMTMDGAGVRQVQVWRRPGAVLVFVPEELRSIKGPPAARRRSLDRLLEAAEPGFADDVAAYQEALSQRNALLRRVRAGAADLRTAFPWEARMAAHGSRIGAARRRMLDILGPRFADWLLRLGGGPGGTLRWEGSPEVLVDADDAQRESALREYFESRRLRDVAAGMTTAGPHRDDVWIGVAGRDLRRLGSQGEQRTAALAMLLAHRGVMRERSSGPILLLDDVLSELDPARRAALLAALEGDEQVIITSADPAAALVDTGRETTVFRVHNGVCTA